MVTPHHADKRTRLAVAVRPCRGGRRSDFETGNGALGESRAQGQRENCNEGSLYFHIVILSVSHLE